MDEEAIEVRGDTARRLNEVAKEQGLTLQELVTHILLSYLEEYSDSDESEADDEEEEEGD